MLARALFIVVLAVVGVLLYFAAVKLPQLGTRSVNSVQDPDVAARLARLLKQNPDLVLPKTVEGLRNEVAADGYALLVLPTQRSAKPADEVTYSAHVIRGEKFTAPLALSIKQAPRETTARVEPSSVPQGADLAVITVSVGTQTPLGKYTLSLVGTGNDTTKIAPVQLTVTNISASDIAVRDVRPMDAGNRWRATVEWSTDVAANSWVEYAPQDVFIESEQEYAYTAKNSTAEPSHAVVLRNLEADTVYHYRIKSVDSLNNVIVSDDAYFVTKAASGA